MLRLAVLLPASVEQKRAFPVRLFGFINARSHAEGFVIRQTSELMRRGGACCMPI